jgi:hypothetical protein
MAAAFLILATAAFIGAIVLYGALMARDKKPVSIFFFDLQKMGRGGSSLAWWAYWLWVTAIVAAVLFGVSQVIRFAQ